MALTPLLNDLHLAAPPSGPRNTDVRVVPPSEIRRNSGDPIALPRPLFAHDLPWYLLDTDTGAALANELVNAWVVTSVLDLDVGGARPSEHVMCPYRPERYGVSIDDLASASFVDLRLTTEVGDGSVYTKKQLQRWDGRADTLPDEMVITGSRWPSDVADTSKLGGKITQLRTFAPDAAVFVTISPFHLNRDLPHVIAAQPDGIILRFDLDPRASSTGKVIATQTATCRRLMNDTSASGMALWIAAPTTSSLDLVKLFALGASAVSIDHLVYQHWPKASAAPRPNQAASQGGDMSGPAAAVVSTEITVGIDELLDEALTFVHGLGVAHYTQLRPNMLACFDPRLAELTGAVLID